MPRVSIVIPAFDREGVLPETLESVERQTCTDWEVIVIDDGSSDRTLEAAHCFVERDPRFKARRRRSPTKGANVCRNEGLAEVQGEFVIFLDSDNLLDPGCLARRLAAMDGAPDAMFGVFQTEVFDTTIGDRGIVCNAFDDTDDLLRILNLDAVWHTTGPIWRTAFIREIGGFDPELASFQEWGIHIRALVSRARYFKVSTRDHYYRMGERCTNRLGRRSVTDPVHLRSHEALFEKTLTTLNRGNRLDEPARIRLAGLFWWLAIRYRAVLSTAEACRLWRKAHRLGLVTRRRLLEGLLIIHMHQLKGGRHFGRPIQWFWPREYYNYFSPTAMTTSIHSMDDRVYWSPQS